MPPRNPPWAEEELILALDLYIRSGLLDDTDPAIAELSYLLKSLNVHAEHPDPDRFRNPNGVAMKLANFAAIDPNYHGRGLTRVGRLDAEVWNRFAPAEDALAAAASAIRAGQEVPSLRPGEATGVYVVDVEAQHVEQFQASVPGWDIEATRREQSLVLSYSDHLKTLGHQVIPD